MTKKTRKYSADEAAELYLDLLKSLNPDAKVLADATKATTRRAGRHVKKMRGAVPSSR